MASTFIENQFQFAEMNIQHRGNPEKTLSLVRRAIRMGYDCVVINTDIGSINQNIEDVVRVLNFLLNHYSSIFYSNSDISTSCS